MASSANLTQLPSLAGVNAFTRPLSPADTEDCAIVENAFPEQERCSKEKFVYRLTKCPELCLGLFIRTEEGSPALIGYVIATRSSSNRVTDGSIEMPPNWQSLAADKVATIDGEAIGSETRGGSIAVHSLAITPAYQGKGVGRGLMNAYIEYIKSGAVYAERIVIIAHDHLIRFYESVGFQNRGPSACQFGGGGWFDLILNC